MVAGLRVEGRDNVSVARSGGCEWPAPRKKVRVGAASYRPEPRAHPLALHPLALRFCGSIFFVSSNCGGSPSFLKPWRRPFAGWAVGEAHES